MNEWIEELADLTAAGDEVVIVTVAGIRGSAPREVGAKMLVTARDSFGTIGGGQLEFQCTRMACEMLGESAGPMLRKFPLGASMGQCCGGVVDILFEPVKRRLPAWLQSLRALHGQREAAVLCTSLKGDAEKVVVTQGDCFGDPGATIIAIAREGLSSGRITHRADDWFYESIVGSNLNIAVFGAGHVGSAVVRTLAALDCNIRWIDSRRRIFRGVPANVRTVEAAEPSLEVSAMPANSCYLVMTHSHAMDFEICERILSRGDSAYCGLIGSRSKRRRFEKRFRSQGMPKDSLASLICPIGVDGISGKKPAEIAIAASAEVLQAHERLRLGRNIAYPDNVHPLKKQ